MRESLNALSMNSGIRQSVILSDRNNRPLRKPFAIILIAVALLHLFSGLSPQFERPVHNLIISDEDGSHHAIEPRAASPTSKPFIDEPPLWAIFGSWPEVAGIGSSLLSERTIWWASDSAFVYFLSQAPPSLH